MFADILGTVHVACLVLGGLMALATILVAWQQALAHERLIGGTHFGVADARVPAKPQTTAADPACRRQKVMRFRSPPGFAPRRRVLCPAQGIR